MSSLSPVSSSPLSGASFAKAAPKPVTLFVLGAWRQFTGIEACMPPKWRTEVGLQMKQTGSLNEKPTSKKKQKHQIAAQFFCSGVSPGERTPEVDGAVGSLVVWPE